MENKQLEEIFNFVVNNAIGEVRVNRQIEPGKEKREVWMLTDYPATGKKYQRNFTYANNPTQEKFMIETCLKSIAQEIFEDLNRPPTEEETGWILEKLIYKVCPQMICGTNPCSCSSNNKEDKDIMF